MSYTVEQLAALKAAVATGALSVRQGSEEVRYRSLQEMQALIAVLERELAPTLAPPRVGFVRYVRD